MAHGPLAGVRVLDLTTVGPGARCAGMLADLGADVIKVGPPATAQRIVPAGWAYSGGRGTRRVGIDLKDPAARDACLALAGTCDVVIEGFRPGVAARLGLGFADVAARRRNVVYASLTGYGQDGPYAQWAGHDLNYQAVSGALATAGLTAEGVPAIPGATYADSAGGGMHAALSICAALVGRTADSEATHLDISAVDGMLTLLSLTLDEHLATGREIGPRSTMLTGRYACYEVYACADGKAVSVAAIEHRFYANLCRALGCERWVEHQHDDDVQDEIRADFRAAFASRSRDEWVALLGPAETCVAPVLAIDEVPGDAHLAARGAFGAVDVDGDAVRQTARSLAGAPRLANEHGVAPHQTQPRALLREAGLGDDDIDKLLAAEVVQ